MLYALATYHWRAQAIRNRGSGPYDDRLGTWAPLTQARPSSRCCSSRRSSSTLCCASASKRLHLHSFLCNRIGMNRYALCADLGHRPVLRIDGPFLDRLERAAQLGALNHLAKDGILPVQMRLLAVRNKELRQAPGVPASGWRSVRPSPSPPCRARGTASAAPTHLERRPDLVVERAPPDRLAALPCPGRIARLHHEASHVAVPQNTIVRARRTVRKKVFSRPRHRLAKHLNLCEQRNAP